MSAHSVESFSFVSSGGNFFAWEAVRRKEEAVAVAVLVVVGVAATLDPSSSASLSPLSERQKA